MNHWSSHTSGSSHKKVIKLPSFACYIDARSPADLELARKVLSDIEKHVSAWHNENLVAEFITLSRLSGLSNACYRVKINLDAANMVSKDVYQSLSKIQP